MDVSEVFDLEMEEDDGGGGEKPEGEEHEKSGSSASSAEDDENGKDDDSGGKSRRKIVKKNKGGPGSKRASPKKKGRKGMPSPKKRAVKKCAFCTSDAVFKEKYCYPHKALVRAAFDDAKRQGKNQVKTYNELKKNQGDKWNTYLKSFSQNCVAGLGAGGCGFGICEMQDVGLQALLCFLGAIARLAKTLFD